RRSYVLAVLGHRYVVDLTFVSGPPDHVITQVIDLPVPDIRIDVGADSKHVNVTPDVAIPPRRRPEHGHRYRPRRPSVHQTSKSIQKLLPKPDKELNGGPGHMIAICHVERCLPGLFRRH